MINNRFAWVKALAVIVVLWIFINIVYPVADLVLDIQILLNVVYALILLAIAFYNKRAKIYYLFPMLLLIAVFLNLGFNISTARLILIRGSDINSRPVSIIVSFIINSGTTGLIISSIIFASCLVIIVFIVPMRICRISETMKRFTTDNLVIEVTAIDAKYSSGEFTTKEAQAEKAAIQRRNDFLASLDGSCKLLSTNEKIRLIIVLVSSIGGILIGTFLRSETAIEAGYTYIPYLISGSLLSMLSMIPLLIAVGWIIFNHSLDGGN